MKYIFPSLMMAMSFGAAIVSMCGGDWRRAGYWASAVAITFFVTV